MERPDVWSLLLSVLVFLFFLELWRLWYPKHQRPPGPLPLPFIGNMLQINFRDPMKSFALLQETYGDLSTVFIGRKPIVILNSYQAVKEALVQSAEEFAGREVFPVLDWISGGLGVVLAPYGPSWKQQRRFMLTTLRNFGLGKKSVEMRIAEEARFLIKAFQDEQGDWCQAAFYNKISSVAAA